MNNKAISFVAAAVCLSVWSTVTFATTQLKQGFENASFTKGATIGHAVVRDSAKNIRVGWNTNNPANIADATLPKVTTTEHHSGKQSLQVTRTKDHKGGQINLELYGRNYNAPGASSLNGEVVTCFYVYMTQGVALRFSTGMSLGSANPSLALLSNGTLGAYSFTGKKGNTRQFVKLKTGLKTDQWYGFKIKTNLSNQTYQVYFDSGQGFEKLDADKLLAPGLNSSISQSVTFKPKGDYGTSFYVDDVSIDTLNADQAAQRATAQAVASGKLLQLANVQAQYVIALAHDAIPAEKTAAQQLQSYLYKITGATFAIKDAAEVPAAARQILVGPGKRVKALLPKLDWNKLGHDGTVIKTVGDKLILAGGRPRGTIYAAFDFLKSLGCRWWTPTASTIPHKPTLNIPAQDVVYVPPFKRREHSGMPLGHPKFTAISHNNGYYYKQSEAWGGHLKQLRCSFAGLLPPKKYFKQHPEWYTDPRNGDRPSTSATPMPTSRKIWQLDTTNPQAVEEYARQAIKYIHDHPGGDTIAIWFNDNTHYCKSPRSLAIVKKYGSPSALMLQFTNKVAQRIHQVYPDYPVQMQAYWWTIDPPKNMQVAPGVEIVSAPIGANVGQPFNSRFNTKQRNRFEGWAKIAPQMQVWYYCTDFNWPMFPFPDWNMGANLKYFADQHVVGVYEQGSRRPIGHFIKLRTWLIAQLLWNPYQSQDQLMKEFLNGYYGAAGPYLGKFIQLVEKTHKAYSDKLSIANADFSFMTLDVTNEGIRLFNQAQEAVKDDATLLERVQQARMTLRAVVLAKLQYYHREAKIQHKTFLGPEDLKKTLISFKEDARKYGIKKFNKGTAEMLKRLARRAENQTARTLPPFAQGYARLDVVDFPADDFALYGLDPKLVHDSAAPTEQVAVMPGNASPIAIRLRFGPALPAKRWHVYVQARVIATPDAKMSGDAFKGVFRGPFANNNSETYKFPMNKLAGKQYHWLDMGVHDLHGSCVINFGGLDRKEIKQINIAQVILIRDGAKKS